MGTVVYPPHFNNGSDAEATRAIFDQIATFVRFKADELEYARQLDRPAIVDLVVDRLTEWRLKQSGEYMTLEEMGIGGRVAEPPNIAG